MFMDEQPLIVRSYDILERIMRGSEELEKKSGSKGTIQSVAMRGRGIWQRNEPNEIGQGMK